MSHHFDSPTAIEVGKPEIRVTLEIAPVRGSIACSAPLAPSSTSTPRCVTASAAGAPPTGSGLPCGRPVAADSRVTVPSPRLATHTEPWPTTTSLGSRPNDPIGSARAEVTCTRSILRARMQCRVSA